jgi:hypothetical protein
MHMPDWCLPATSAQQVTPWVAPRASTTTAHPTKLLYTLHNILL